jgi:feruloyl-CoA synthase
VEVGDKWKMSSRIGSDSAIRGSVAVVCALLSCVCRSRPRKRDSFFSGIGFTIPAMPNPPFFEDPMQLAPRRTVKTDLGGGAFTLHHPEPLAPYARCVGEWLERWARETPDAPAFAEPDANGGWRTLTYRALRQQVGSVAQTLLDKKLPADRPVVVLSDNALDHLVLMLAAMHVGRAVCSISSGYCRLAQGDFTRIHGILRTLAPALVYASDAATYGAALVDAPVADAVIVFSDGADAHRGAQPFAQLLAAKETPAVLSAFKAITPYTRAKYLLTSGSTGQPKVVINTHKMLTANQQMLGQTLRFLERDKPVLLDWLPWSHTFGGNHNIGLVLRNGGTMFIDDGKPLPGLIDKTVAHLRSVQPTVYFNVPRGYEMLLPALEADAALAARFFEKLKMVFYAGSGMPETTWRRLEAVAAKVRDEAVWFTTSWGSTETSPAITFANWQLERPGVIGLPLPGASVKFVPNGGKLEMRVKGDHIFPGYRHNEAATREAFDDDGWYRIGDAGFLLEEDHPASGIVFNGRVAEDFKLTSGTWVSVGTLRLQVVTALAPLAQDVVITGHDKSEIGVLIFLTEAARKLPHDEVAAKVREALRAMKAGGAGSSQTPARALLLPDAPSMAAGEITDKGYINQRLVLQRRAAEVELLHGSAMSERVIRA